MALSVQRGFETLGWCASVVPYSDWFPKLPALPFRGAGAVNGVARMAARPYFEVRLLRRLEALAPDLVLFIKADDLSVRFYRRLRVQVPAIIAAFHPDDPFNTGHWMHPGPSSPRAITQMREVDHFFAWSLPLVSQVDAFAPETAVHHLSFACDPTLNPRVDPLDVPMSLRSKVIFIGNWDHERERWLGPLAAANVGLTVWGAAAWKTRCRNAAITNAWRGRPLFGDEASQALAGARICINLLRKQNKHAVNMRTFEVPCAGGFMLHEQSAELPLYFRPSRDCCVFNSPEGLVETVRRLLPDEDRRARIAAAGFERAGSHSYEGWARSVAAAVGLPAEKV